MTARRPVAARVAATGRDDGSASVLAVGVMLAIVLLLGGLLAVGAAARATHRMRAAADLGALAGATRRQGGADPAQACAVAREVARANGARDVECRVEGAVVQVRASRPVDLAGVFPGMPLASAMARAGPAAARVDRARGAGPGGAGDYPFAAASG